MFLLSVLPPPVRAGQYTEAARWRQAMLYQQGRICYRGEFPLQDWLVPVSISKIRQTLPFTGRSATSAAVLRASHCHRTSPRTTPRMASLAVTVQCWRWNAPCVARRRDIDPWPGWHWQNHAGQRVCGAG